MHTDFYTRRRTSSVASHGPEIRLESKRPKFSRQSRCWLHAIMAVCTCITVPVALIAFE